MKTRLQPELDEATSLALYVAMVQDLVDELRKSSLFDIRIWYWPPENESDVRAVINPLVGIEMQQGDDLGKRMLSAFQWANTNDYRRTVIVGSDIPELTLGIVHEAFQILENRDAVIGPSPDGGYYLIGLNEPIPSLFQHINWSTETVLEETVRRIESTGHTFQSLQIIEDIDTFNDVANLHQRWKQMNETGGVIQAKRTFSAIEKIFIKEGRHG